MHIYIFNYAKNKILRKYMFSQIKKYICAGWWWLKVCRLCCQTLANLDASYPPLPPSGKISPVS